MLKSHGITGGTFAAVIHGYRIWLADAVNKIDSVVCTAAFSDAEQGYLLMITYYEKK